MTRALYLFDLANLCSVTPPEVNGMAVADFGRLVGGIKAYRAAQSKEAR